MTKSNILFVGLDVHKESIDVALAEDGISGIIVGHPIYRYQWRI